MSYTKSYRLCMEAFRRGGDAAGALSVLARMRVEGRKPDLVSVHVVRTLASNPYCYLVSLGLGLGVIFV